VLRWVAGFRETIEQNFENAVVFSSLVEDSGIDRQRAGVVCSGLHFLFMRILSGIQPSGILHLGNYFGMMQPALRLQDEGEAFYFIADLHALTTVRDGAALSSHIRELALDFLACGLNPERTAFFRQSAIPAVTELAWILSTLTPMGLLERCHSYKDKQNRGLPATHGLFSYPVLMAADILIYDSDVVPVGQDQKQHLEVTRDLASKFNDLYGEVFRLPEPRISETTAIVPGTDGAKMSKSYENTIPLFPEDTALRKKVMGIKTDSTPVEEPKDPSASTVLSLYRLVASPEECASMEASFLAGGTGYGTYKKQLLEVLMDYFAPMRARRMELLEDPGYVNEVLANGARRARLAADGVMDRVRSAVGL
jgi:tryptophanyl-tRNA synthetase